MKTIADRAVQELPLLTRQHAVEEGRRDPRFWSHLGSLVSRWDAAKAVDDDMKKAVINELDPSAHPEVAGRWPVLREKVRKLRGAIADHSYMTRSAAGVGDIPGMVTNYDQLTTPAPSAYPSGPNLAPGQTAPAASASGGSDIWSTIGKALSTVGQAAGQIYATKITTGAQQDIAKIQAQAAQGIALTQAQQQQLAQAKAAAAAGDGSSNVVLYILLGLLGLGGLMLVFTLMKGKR